MSELTVTMVPIDELEPDPENPRNNTSAIEKVAASMRECGIKVPLVINDEMKIIAGHSLFHAARIIKLDTVPCVVADDLSEEQQLGFAIAENRTSDFSFFDLNKLADIADRLSEEYIAEFDLEGLLAGADLEPDLEMPQGKSRTRSVRASTSRRSRSTSTSSSSAATRTTTRTCWRCSAWRTSRPPTSART